MSVLNTILYHAQKYKEKGQLVAIFDLDSTVFNVSPRTQKILQDFAQSKSYQAKFPKTLLEDLSQVQVRTQDWGIKEALIRSKIEAPLEFFESLRDYWFEHFFSNSYLFHDEPYPGAIEFIKTLHNKGARIVYLTGRDKHRMGDGTHKVLKHWGLPLDSYNKLILKPKKGMSDSLYKLDMIDQLSKEHPETWAFENEPVNINLIAKELKQVKVVFFESTHSRREELMHEMPILKAEFPFLAD